jgi:hypothetical protein
MRRRASIIGRILAPVSYDPVSKVPLSNRTCPIRSIRLTEDCSSSGFRIVSFLSLGTEIKLVLELSRFSWGLLVLSDMPSRLPLKQAPITSRGPSLAPLMRARQGYVVLAFQCRVGGGALACWPPSAAQTVHTVFPYTAFMNALSRRELKVSAKCTFLLPSSFR